MNKSRVFPKQSKANALAWEDIIVGLVSSFSVLVSEEMVNQFLQLSGDFNPLHIDDQYAEQTKFSKRVVPGMLLASFFSRLVGMHIPGEKSLYISQSLAFKNPAFIGDEVLVQGTVTRVSDPLKIVTLNTTITNSKTNQTLVNGECKALYLLSP